MSDAPKYNVVCLSKPKSMGAVLARHYSDYPLSRMPDFAVRILARRWRNNPHVFYVEARTEQDEYMGFLFGQTLGETPWRTLMSDPIWMTPFAAIPILSRRFNLRLPDNPEEDQSQANLPSVETSSPALDLPPLPDGILQSEHYMKMEYMEIVPRFRGMRIANYLYMAMEDEARAAGLRMMSSRIAIHNIASVKALHRAGYTVYMRTPSELRSIKFLESTGST